jgi:putative CocE/NonD family hydrolase
LYRFAHFVFDLLHTRRARLPCDTVTAMKLETFRAWLLIAALLPAGVVSRATAQRPTPAVHDRNVDVRMRDGVILRADVLRPSSSGRFPTLIYRTPYDKDEELQEYTTFTHAVARGYAVVVQDVRGRYASDGEFRPYEHDGRDGYDTIEWAAAQSWSNGRVGTFGLSYPGAVQWLAAVENPPHLQAMVPAMTFSTPQNFFYSGGIWDMSWIEWIWQNAAADARRRKGLPPARRDGPLSWKAIGEKMLRTLPLDRVEPLRDVAPYYYDWLHHPPEDPFWDFAELRDKYVRTRAAVLNLSGWNDDNYGPEGATTNYVGLLRSRDGDSSRAALLVGPWTHGVDSTARTKFGDQEFGRAAAIDYDAVVIGWMDRYLGDGSSPAGSPVRYFVMGDNRWRESPTWPPPGRETSFYLSGSSSGRRGVLATAPPDADAGPSAFVSDPASPVINPYDSAGAHDYRALADRNDVLVFDSAPFRDDTEVTGSIRARVFVSCDCRDTDLWVRVLDVTPEGAAYNLMSPGLDAIRASYRELSKGRQLLIPGQIYELAIDTLVTSNLFRRGHRIRVQVSASFFPNFSRNLHTGELETVSARMQRATVRVHHDRAHPSRIVVPVADR